VQPQLIARRAQARGDVLERRGKVEAAFAFDGIENRRKVERLALDAVEDLQARPGRLPVHKGWSFLVASETGGENTIRKSPKSEVKFRHLL
jgi:hypothetical protein